MIRLRSIDSGVVVSVTPELAERLMSAGGWEPADAPKPRRATRKGARDDMAAAG